MLLVANRYPTPVRSGQTFLESALVVDSIFKQPAVCRHGFAIPGPNTPGALRSVLPLSMKGAGNAGRAMHPQPRVRNKKAHEHSHHGHTGVTRHSLRNGFNGLYRALPGDRACLSPSSAELPPPT